MIKMISCFRIKIVVTLGKEEDATVWARYSSAYFEQAAGRQACNNPYNQDLDNELAKRMEEKGTNKITFVEFLDLIQPSFAAIDSKEDMDAILARTHVVLLGEHGVYWRVASIEKKEVNFEPWPKDEKKDLLAEDQVPIFKAYKANPTNHQLPPNFHEDSVWSQEVLCRLVAGESIPKIVTHVRHTGMFGQEVPARQVAPAVMPATEAKAKVKQEKVNYVWRFLKRAGPLQIELDSPSPSPAKRSRSSNEPSHAAALSIQAYLDYPKRKRIRSRMTSCQLLEKMSWKMRM